MCVCQGEDVLEEFLKQRKEESSAVLQADQSLSAMDKQMCGEDSVCVFVCVRASVCVCGVGAGVKVKH